MFTPGPEEAAKSHSRSDAQPGRALESGNDFSDEATLRYRATAVTLLFRFDENGLIKSVRAEARGRTVGATVIPTPWEGRWGNYERHDGMYIPTEGEVAWVLAEGPKTYRRSHH